MGGWVEAPSASGWAGDGREYRIRRWRTCGIEVFWRTGGGLDRFLHSLRSVEMTVGAVGGTKEGERGSKWRNAVVPTAAKRVEGVRQGGVGPSTGSGWLKKYYFFGHFFVDLGLAIWENEQLFASRQTSDASRRCLIGR